MTAPDPLSLVRDVLPPADLAWLEKARARAAADPRSVILLFPAVGRHCGRRRALDAGGRRLDDACRALLLDATTGPVLDLLGDLYHDGGVDERRAVLKALPRLLDRLPAESAALALVHDALRGDDPVLLEAAVGPYGGRHLDQDSFRRAVLKCALAGVPLTAVATLRERADRTLARMLAGLVRDRAAAGLDLPEGVWVVLHDHPDLVLDLDADEAVRVPGEARTWAPRLARTLGMGGA
ncbi:EboA domain-containing protein [Actinomadura rugatobispora]|uniref:EboA domain-containing protein n=1 Tax=Actinomadura rugatobispora TaxID=1994 RepID=A0ABW1AHD6_9ACTN|nr:EboA domain-containing protein [Actinomadura rugatobispora]